MTKYNRVLSEEKRSKPASSWTPPVLSEEREQARMDLWNEEGAPILAELAEAGFILDSIWSQHKRSNRSKPVLDIWAKHLQLPYSDKTKNGLARALGQREAKPYWTIVKSEYLETEEGVDDDGVLLGAKEGLAAALSEIADRTLLDELIELARDPRNGTSRILLLRPINRSRDPKAKAALDELANDPVLAKQIAIFRKNKKPKTPR